MNSEVLVLTARLLKYLEIKEREALVGTIMFGRVRKKKDTEKEEKGSRFQIAPNFGFPSACDERPVSADGRATIHFKQVMVVKRAKYKGEKRGKNSADLVIKGDKDTPATISGSPTAPSDNDSYITREGAVMTITAAAFDGYMTEGKLQQGQKAIISNISDDPVKRKEFWDAVVRREREPSPDRITLFPDRLTLQQWSEVAVRLERGHPLKRIVRAAMNSRFVMDTTGSEAAPVSAEIDGRHFRELCGRLKKVTDLDRSKLPASLWRGRGGRVQRRFVAELPAGISEAARLRIAVRFAEHLAEFGMMYTVVIHAPDHHNHEKNFHLHAVAYDRPCRFLVEHNCWDFDYAVPVPGQHNRFTFPERQDKPSKLTRSADGRGNYRFYGAALMEGFRRAFTALCNEELRLTPFNYLYDHRSYKVLRIIGEPQKHLGTKAASLGAVGVPVNSAIENAERSWQGAFDRARAAHRLRLEVRSDCRTEASMMLERVRMFEGETELAGTLAREIGRLDTLTGELGDHELHIENLRLTLNMVYSSAEKTEETCRRLLEAIEDGTAKASECAMERAIRERLREAEAWQARVDNAELDRIQSAEGFAKVIQAKTAGLEQAMERIRNCIDASEAQITNVPTARSKDARSEETWPAPKKIDARSRRIQDYYDAPLDYEESWDRVFSRIKYEEIEIKAPTTATPVFHVPGISKEELDLLLNPFFQKRSQARLEQMHKYQELNRQRSEKRQAAATSFDVVPFEPASEETEARSLDEAFDHLQHEAVPSQVAGEGAQEHPKQTPAAVQVDSAEEASKDAQAETVERKGSEPNAEQPSAHEALPDMPGVRDVFTEKVSRGPRKRRDNPLRRVAREIADGMTSEDAAAAVSGVAKTKPDGTDLDREETSVQPTSTHTDPAFDPQQEQPGLTKESGSDLSRVADAFADKLSRGSKKRPDNPLRKVAREIAHEMTPEDAADAVNGVVKTKPEDRNVDPESTSVERASDLGHPAAESRHSPNRETDKSPAAKDQASALPSQTDEEGMTAEQQWERLKNGGRGR